MYILLFIAVFALVIFVCYSIIKTKIEKQRQELFEDVFSYLRLSNFDSCLKKYDDIVIVKSRQTLNKYDDIKYLKEHDCFNEVKQIASLRKDIKKDIKAFLKENEFKERPQYNYVASQLNYLLTLATGYRIKVVYITSAGNNKGERLINISDSRAKEIDDHPEYLMTKSEYNKLLKEQEKEELEDKKHEFYDRVNSIIDLANNSKDTLIVKARIKMLDELIQQLFDRTINSIQKIKQIDSDEWYMIENFIINIETQVTKIIDEDRKISEYYASDDFAQIKETCNSLNLSRKEFNEYIDEKAQSISKLFGTRVVRNETQHEDTYNYIRTYKKSITPFTADVSASVFGSAENSPINYIVKYFYPNKSQYKEQ